MCNFTDVLTCIYYTRSAAQTLLTQLCSGTHSMRCIYPIRMRHACSLDQGSQVGLVLEVLVNRLRRFSGAKAACACMDALLTLLLDNDPNQARFVQLQGVEKAGSQYIDLPHDLSHQLSQSAP